MASAAGAGAAGADGGASLLAPLWRRSRVELVLATGALALAAVLGTIAPPGTGQAAATAGLSASGADFATTVRVRLTTTSAEPGPNGFAVRVTDADSGAAHRATLACGCASRPLDDPEVEQTALTLKPGTTAGSYAGAARTSPSTGAGA